MSGGEWWENRDEVRGFQGKVCKDKEVVLMRKVQYRGTF